MVDSTSDFREANFPKPFENPRGVDSYGPEIPELSLRDFRDGLASHINWAMKGRSKGFESSWTVIGPDVSPRVLTNPESKVRAEDTALIVLYQSQSTYLGPELGMRYDHSAQLARLERRKRADGTFDVLIYRIGEPIITELGESLVPCILTDQTANETRLHNGLINIEYYTDNEKNNLYRQKDSPDARAVHTRKITASDKPIVDTIERGFTDGIHFSDAQMSEALVELRTNPDLTLAQVFTGRQNKGLSPSYNPNLAPKATSA